MDEKAVQGVNLQCLCSDIRSHAFEYTLSGERHTFQFLFCFVEDNKQHDTDGKGYQKVERFEDGDTVIEIDGCSQNNDKQ